MFLLFVTDFLYEPMVIDIFAIGGIVLSGIMLIMSIHRKIEVFTEKCVYVVGFLRKEYEFVGFGGAKSKVQIVSMDVLNDDIITVYTFYSKKGKRLFSINERMENATRFYNEIKSYLR